MNLKPLIRSLLLGLIFSAGHAFAQSTTAFTYQGQLHDGGTNANGTYAMTFKLYDALTSGNQIGNTISTSPTLANGLFTVDLDFGASAFNGGARWLDITVSNGVTQTLSPRVQVLPVPYAMYAGNAAALASGTWSAGVGNFAGATNVFGLLANGAVVLGLGTNGIYVPGSIEAKDISTEHLDLGTNYLSLGNQNTSIHGTTNSEVLVNGSLIVSGQDAHFNTPGGVLVDGKQVMTAPEKLYLIRGRVNGDGTIANGSGFSVSFTPAGSGGTVVGSVEVYANDNRALAYGSNYTAQLMVGKYLLVGNIAAKISSFTFGLVEIPGQPNIFTTGTSITFDQNPSGGSSGSRTIKRDMTLYPTYSVTLSNAFNGVPTVTLGGAGGWATQQAPGQESYQHWEVYLDYAQARTANSFGVIVSPGVNVTPFVPNQLVGFEFIAVGPR